MPQQNENPSQADENTIIDTIQEGLSVGKKLAPAPIKRAVDTLNIVIEVYQDRNEDLPLWKVIIIDTATGATAIVSGIALFTVATEAGAIATAINPVGGFLVFYSGYVAAGETVLEISSATERDTFEWVTSEEFIRQEEALGDLLLELRNSTRTSINQFGNLYDEIITQFSNISLFSLWENNGITQLSIQTDGTELDTFQVIEQISETQISLSSDAIPSLVPGSVVSVDDQSLTLIDRYPLSNLALELGFTGAEAFKVVNPIGTLLYQTDPQLGEVLVYRAGDMVTLPDGSQMEIGELLLRIQLGTFELETTGSSLTSSELNTQFPFGTIPDMPQGMADNLRNHCDDMPDPELCFIELASRCVKSDLLGNPGNLFLLDCRTLVIRELNPLGSVGPQNPIISNAALLADMCDDLVPPDRCVFLSNDKAGYYIMTMLDATLPGETLEFGRNFEIWVIEPDKQSEHTSYLITDGNEEGKIFFNGDVVEGQAELTSYTHTLYPGRPIYVLRTNYNTYYIDVDYANGSIKIVTEAYRGLFVKEFDNEFRPYFLGLDDHPDPNFIRHMAEVTIDYTTLDAYGIKGIPIGQNRRFNTPTVSEDWMNRHTPHATSPQIFTADLNGGLMLGLLLFRVGKHLSALGKR